MLNAQFSYKKVTICSKFPDELYNPEIKMQSPKTITKRIPLNVVHGILGNLASHNYHKVNFGGHNPTNE